jgi:hypothetical protein
MFKISISNDNWDDAVNFSKNFIHPISFDIETTRLVNKLYYAKNSKNYVDFIYNIADYLIVLVGMTTIDDYCKGFAIRTLPTLKTYIEKRNLTNLALNNYLEKRLLYFKTIEINEILEIFREK